MSKIIKIREDHLSQFSSDVDSLWAKPITTLDSPPTPLVFLREYVNLSVPVLIKNAFPTLTLDELVTSVDHDENLKLNVDVTPDGHGDTVRIVDGEKMFVMPETRSMSFAEFRNQLRKKRGESEINWSTDSSSLEKDENGRRVFSSSHHEASDNDDSNTTIDDAVFYYSRQVCCCVLLVQRLIYHRSTN